MTETQAERDRDWHGDDAAPYHVRLTSDPDVYIPLLRWCDAGKQYQYQQLQIGCGWLCRN
jgi:hypothetical protein